MPGASGERSVLAPSGHPSVDQARIAGQAHVRTDSEALCHPRSQAFDENVGPVHQAQHGLWSGRVLQVDGNRAARAGQRVGRDQAGAAARPVDAQHIGTQVGEHHAGVRRRSQPGQLDEPDAGQWPLPGHVTSRVGSQHCTQEIFERVRKNACARLS